MMNSENLGARGMKNGALDRKIWALEAFNGKTIFLGDSRGDSRIFWSCWRVFTQKTGAFVEFWEFLGIFVDFWSIWSGLGCTHK
jgi:hypothetical protein